MNLRKRRISGRGERTLREIRIVDDEQRVRLALRVEGGRVVAEYDEADLDGAAKRLIDAVRWGTRS